jgi:hypothetical protein
MGLGETSPDGIEDGVQTTGHFEFLEDAVQMGLDRLFTDEKVLGNFFVGAAGDQVLEDFDLPGGEAFFGSFRRASRRGIIISQGLEELRHHAPLDP